MGLIEQLVENRTNELRNMQLHERLPIGKWISVFRVVGGWIYQFNCPPDEGNDFGVFVPEEKAK